jgi:1-phosphofructokinase family hexose kinase
MIFTLTPNPSVDRSLTVPEIRFNNVLRSKNMRLDWGGKGFNVSRSLQQFGIESMAIAWVGGGTGKILADGLQRLGIQTDFVWVDGETRTNTMLIEDSGDWHIKINEPGPSISEDEIEQLYLKVESYAKKDDLWILSGSLPLNVSEDFYAKLIALLKSRGVRIYLDTNGMPLYYGCQASPYMVKPNAIEAAQIVDFSIDDQEDAKRAALPFLRMGVEIFAMTMGAAGLLLATQREMVYAAPPKVNVRNAAGSGDALLAGMIYAQMRELDLVEVARWAVATGTASVETDGVSEFTIDRIQEIFNEVESTVINVM